MTTSTYSIITVDNEGRQLTGSGYITFVDMVKHIAERLRNDRYIRFVVVETIAENGQVVTGAYDWDRTRAAKLVADVL